MTKQELIKRLNDLWGKDKFVDVEAVHGTADDLLLEYINDPEIKKAFDDVPKWYA